MYLDRKFGLSLSLSEITLLFDLSMYLDRTLAQRKAKSKVKVTHCHTGDRCSVELLGHTQRPDRLSSDTCQQ